MELAPLDVYVGSMGPGVQWDLVPENHVVPVHREMCKYVIIPSSPGPIEHQVPLNPRIPLHQGGEAHGVQARRLRALVRQRVQRALQGV